MDIKEILPKRVGGTRWMPHTKLALESLFRGFPVYAAHLENESHTNAKAEGLARLITSYNVITFALVLQVKHTAFSSKIPNKIINSLIYI